MKKADIVWVVGSVYAGAVAFFYCWPRWFSWVARILPRYYPAQHTWKLGKRAGEISQAWYSMQVFAFLAAGVAAAITYYIVKTKVKGDLKPATIKLMGIAACVFIVAGMAYMLWYEFDHWKIF